MFLKGLKNMEIAWYDSDYLVGLGRIFDYPDSLALLLLRHGLAEIPVSSDFVVEVKFWAQSVSPPMTKKQILQTVKTTFGVDLFARVVS